MKWYKFDIRELTSDDYLKWYALMSREKQARVDRFRFVNDKKRAVAGEMLARKAISEWCNVPENSMVFEQTETGKPYAKDLPVEFNISHSGDMVVCAVDDKLIGIDIEKIRPIDLKVAKHICTDEELIYLFGCTPADQNFIYTSDCEILTRFFKIWTAKEACCKQKGVGIAALQSTAGNYSVRMIHYMEEGYMICIAEL